LAVGVEVNRQRSTIAKFLRADVDVQLYGLSLCEEETEFRKRYPLLRGGFPAKRKSRTVGPMRELPSSWLAESV